MTRKARKVTPDMLADIRKHYESYDMSVSSLAKKYGICPRTIERYMHKAGILREPTSARKMAAKYRDYSHLKAQKLLTARRTIPLKLRYKILREHPYCAICGVTADAGGLLQIDHKNNNSGDNRPDNLQVLCSECNKGKYWAEINEIRSEYGADAD